MRAPNLFADSPELVTMKALAMADARQAAESLATGEARLLVDQYYLIQGNRIRAGNQYAAMSAQAEPAFFEGWLSQQMEAIEVSIRKVLDAYSDRETIGRWMRLNVGIGPVIAAGLLAHLDIKKAEVAGAFWRFAGLDPTQRWEKGEKRPWNADLKTLCWKIGESFVKVSGNDQSLYGRLYAERKVELVTANDAGEFEAAAAEALQAKRYRKTTDAYKAYVAGKLPPAHVHARAKRYAVKLFLSHLFEVWYQLDRGVKPPRPFALEHLGHAHYVTPEVPLDAVLE